jgi:hypothetical protein
MALIFLISACKKDEFTLNNLNTTEGNTKDSVYVKEGVLHFNDQQVFNNVSQQLATMSKNELDKWEDNLGFYSVRRLNEAIKNELGQAESEKEFNELLNVYSPYITIEDDKIDPILEISLYANVCNENLVYAIGKQYYKINGDSIFVYDRKENLSNLKIGNIGEDYIKAMPYQTKSVNSCITYLTESYDNGTRRCDNSIIIYYDYQSAGDIRIDYMRCYAVSYIHSWGKWRRYNTDITVRGNKFEGTIPSYNRTKQLWEYSNSYVETFDQANLPDADYVCVDINVGFTVHKTGTVSPGICPSIMSSLATTIGIGGVWVVTPKN